MVIVTDAVSSASHTFVGSFGTVHTVTGVNVASRPDPTAVTVVDVLGFTVIWQRNCQVSLMSSLEFWLVSPALNPLTRTPAGVQPLLAVTVGLVRTSSACVASFFSNQ